MKTKYLLAFLLNTILGIFPALSQDNTLSIPNISITQGQSIDLPIYMNNTADIVAIQFTMTVPVGIKINEKENIELSERIQDHTIRFEEVEPNQYMFIIFSPTNKPFIGSAGRIFSVNIGADFSLEENSEHKIHLSNVVIGGKDGSNLMTGYTAGNIKIEKSADLEVSNVITSKSNIGPNEVVSINWQVENVGGAPAMEGWNEQIFLEGADNYSKLIATVYYKGTLEKGAIVSRSADITIPQVTTIDGTTKIKVQLTPNSQSGEPIWLRDNNSSVSKNIITVNKELILEPKEVNISEATTEMIRYQLVRSGNINYDEIFNLNSISDDRLIFPKQIKIKKGHSGVYFYVEVNPNRKLDNDSIVEFSISGNNYPSVASNVTLEDDTYPPLYLISNTDEVEEGDTIHFTIKTEKISENDIKIRLQSDYQSRFKIPNSIIIPAGHSSVDVTVIALDNDVTNIDETVSFTASTDKYNRSILYIMLVDNDVPALQVETTHNEISEAAGPLAITAKISRKDNINKRIVVKLTDDSDSEIFYGRNMVVMESGVECITFNLGPIDNTIVDGERTYNIKAAVWVPSCDCNAGNEKTGGTVNIPLKIYDNDGPSLSMSSETSILKEGGEMKITLKSNVNITKDLIVKLSSDQDNELRYLKTITIPAGSKSTSFVIKTRENLNTKDGFTAMIHAEAEGFSKANFMFSVSDQTLPDAQVSNIYLSANKVKVGESTDIHLMIVNKGSYLLPEQTPVTVYINNATNLATKYSLQKNLEPGDSVLLKRTITLPNQIDQYNVHAIINEENIIKELNHNNNSSQLVSVNVVSPYTITLQSDKKVYNQGEKVKLFGEIYGNEIYNKEIELYVINENYRHVINVVTDKDGKFETYYEPYPGQIGIFKAGACYPNEGLTKEFVSFDFYGIKRTSNSNITCDILLGNTFTNQFTVSNPSRTKLSGVIVDVVSKPQNCIVDISCPENVGPNSNFDIKYKIKPTENTSGEDWEKIVLKLTTNEGLSLISTIYYYCRSPKSELKASITRINTTMIKGKSRDYIFEITNRGKGSTGKIFLELPEWMESVTPKELPPLEYGDSTSIILRLSPTEDMASNVPVSGHIALNCTNGKGLSIPFYIEPVSKSNGTLVVDVRDESTYYTEEKPHVEGATVLVKHPTTGKVFIEGKTDKNGEFRVILPEGYYSINVSEKRHSSYRNNILIDPGIENNLVVNLSVEAIRVDWDVVETTIEDEYSIVTNVEFETNVPVPVIDLIIPDQIEVDKLSEGESLIFHATLTNKGLITAQDVELRLPTELKNLKFEAMAYKEPFNITPQQSVLIPVKVTYSAPELKGSNRRSTTRANTGIECSTQTGVLYYWDCGVDRKWHTYEKSIQIGTCHGDGHSNWTPSNNNYTGIITHWPVNIPAPSLPRPNVNRGSGQSYSPDWTIPNITVDEDEGCEPCQNKFLMDLVNCALDKPPYFDCLGGLASCHNEHSEGNVTAQHYLDCALTVIGCATEACGNLVKHVGIKAACEGLGDALDMADCLDKLTEPCENEARTKGKNLKNHSNFIEEFQSKISIAQKEINAWISALSELFGGEEWISQTSMSELHHLLFAICVTQDSILNPENLYEFKPEHISKEQFTKFIERINNTNKVLSGNSTIRSNNYINGNVLGSYYETMEDAEKASQELGYNSTYEMLQSEATNIKKKLEEGSSAVCASISLQISQKMVLTRQAFRGTLTIFNGNEIGEMSDISLRLNITDEMGNIATSHEIESVLEHISNFEGEENLDATWSLRPQQTGIIEILFIPTKYAAPTTEKIYSFGGQLSYVDPYTGLTITRDLLPVTLTVKPSPNLDLTYFMQRDIKGDDPLTEEIEASEDAEFSLLINNIGYGDAQNVKMVTEQPKIIENEKGLHIDFELISSQLNGKEKVLALGGSVATDIGTIPAHSSAYVQWWLKSSLLGHFVKYDVKATHVTSHGNPDLSLLNEVSIHELIRSVKIDNGNDYLTGFITNDIADINDTPDMIYISNGDVESVSHSVANNIEKISNTEYCLSISAENIGWFYGNILDPTYGISRIKSIIRKSDGKNISLQNFWQTDYTLRDGKEPLYENRIHFADEIKQIGEEQYLIEFDPMPSVLLEVTEIDNIPKEGTLATEPINEINIIFNKGIDPSTFTTEDITLSIQGVKQNLEGIQIICKDNKTFTLDFSNINENLENGFFVLKIQTTGIIDNEGFPGYKGKYASWIMYRNGNVQVKAITNPISAGDLNVENNAYTKKLNRPFSTKANEDVLKYGTKVKFIATQNEGYEFENWTVNGEIISNEKEFEYFVLGDMDIVANYIKKSYTIEINNEIQGGNIVGASTGIYGYGDYIELTPKPSKGYMFVAWNVDGQELLDDTLKITIKKKMNISATFKSIVHEQKLSLSKGWNWISTFLEEPISSTSFSGGALQIISQFDENIYDPNYGMVGSINSFKPGIAYKINLIYPITKSFIGTIHDVKNNPIVLNKGWNWISYPYYKSINLNDAIKDASDKEYITSLRGFAEFVNGYWEGTLTDLLPGEGYLYKSTTNRNLLFNFSDEMFEDYKIKKQNEKTLSDNIHQYPSTMNLIARISYGTEELDNESYRIYAFAGNKCRGVSEFIGENHYLTIHGDKSETIHFIVENVNNENTYLAQETVIFTEDILGSREDPFKITISESTGINSSTSHSKTLSVYNIYGILLNQNATKDYIRNLKQGIYIIGGQKYIVK